MSRWEKEKESAQNEVHFWNVIVFISIYLCNYEPYDQLRVIIPNVIKAIGMNVNNRQPDCNQSYLKNNCKL